MEMEITIATHNGSKVARAHNRRDPKVICKEDHIDPEGHFEVWLDLDPKAEYERIFGQAVKEYNEKQTRDDRKIDDYYAKICKDEKKHAVYEMIVGIYGRNDDGSPVCSKNDGKAILRAFYEDWQRRNPHLVLVGAYYHADEQGEPHVHLDYICVADGYSRGMKVQSSMSRALQQQGFIAQGQLTEQIQWEARENQFLGSLCCSRGFRVMHPGSKEHQDTETFKAQKRLQQLKQEQAAVSQDIELKKQERDELDDEVQTLRARKELHKAVLAATEQPEHELQIERIPEKKNPITKQVTPPKVVLLEDDYNQLCQRAQATSWLKKALYDLQHMGERLTKELNQRRRVSELQERAAAAELAARSAEHELLFARGQIADAQQEALQQQEWMQSIQADRTGKTLWEYFLDFITKQREREIMEREL